eukprot:8674099-Pyramimonas_sp.AAC.1
MALLGVQESVTVPLSLDFGHRLYGYMGPLLRPYGHSSGQKSTTRSVIYWERKKENMPTTATSLPYTNEMD